MPLYGAARNRWLLSPVRGARIASPFTLNPPGTLTFSLSACEQRVQIAGDHGDGVRIRVLLQEETRAPVLVGERLVNPRDLPAERGDQTLVFAFASPTGGGHLILSVDPGPAGNGAWDWFYLAGLKID